MIVPNPNWYRWVLVAATKHFKAVADANGIYFHIQGTHRDTSSKDRYIEFHLDGPVITQLSRGQFHFEFGVTLLYSTDVTSNYQDDVILAGLLLESLSEICVLDNDDNYIGRLLPVEGRSVTNNFGFISLDSKIKQGSVEALFEIDLEN
jgi:hypothetical protein